MGYWEAYKKVTATNLKVYGIFVFIAVIYIVLTTSRKTF